VQSATVASSRTTEAEQRQREFEKQKAAEAEAAKQRDRQAYRERAGLMSAVPPKAAV
jgi:hypothetical protein